MSANRMYHADDHTVGHAWLDIYFMDTNRIERLVPMRDRLDYVIAHPVTEALSFGQKPRTPGVSITDRWTWCDALFMAPPTLTRLSAATGDKKYLEFLDLEYRYTYDMLWDKQEHFFYRDASFFDKKTPTGKKHSGVAATVGFIEGCACCWSPCQRITPRAASTNTSSVR